MWSLKDNTYTFVFLKQMKIGFYFFAFGERLYSFINIFSFVNNTHSKKKKKKKNCKSVN